MPGITDSKYLRKIKTPVALAKILAQAKAKGKKVVQCHGVFDLLHLGHIRHFNLAKKEGDILVVTLTADKFVKRGPGRPVFNQYLRAETLASLEMTDFVSIINDATATEFIKLVKPNIYAKGSDYKVREKDVTGKIYEEEEAVQLVGGRLVFTDDITFSSSQLINNFLNVYPPKTIRYLKAFGKKYSLDFVLGALENLKKLKVLVIGDAIIDEYHYCSPLGKSAKEHLVVYRYLSEEKFAGGSLAVANNVAAVCGQVDLLTLLGAKNSYQDFIQDHLSPNVHPIFFARPDCETIVKRRYVNREDSKKLFENCYLQDKDIAGEEETKITEQIDKMIQKYDLVVVADFGHGFLTKKLIGRICAKSKYLSVNVQTNSANAGFNLVTKYPRANCICVDERELRFATHDRFGDLQKLIKEVFVKMHGDNIIATRGFMGSLAYSKKEGFSETPAFADRVVDIIGAGDAFFAFVSPCFANRMPQDLVAFIGNAVGSLAVQIVCNRAPVNKVDLIKFITRLLKI